MDYFSSWLLLFYSVMLRKGWLSFLTGVKTDNFLDQILVIFKIIIVIIMIIKNAWMCIIKKFEKKAEREDGYFYSNIIIIRHIYILYKICAWRGNKLFLWRWEKKRVKREGTIITERWTEDIKSILSRPKKPNLTTTTTTTNIFFQCKIVDDLINFGNHELVYPTAPLWTHIKIFLMCAPTEDRTRQKKKTDEWWKE